MKLLYVPVQSALLSFIELNNFNNLRDGVIQYEN